MIQACCTFLENQLDPSNALGIAAFAEQHHCNNLYKAANEFIDQHFIQVCINIQYLYNVYVKTVLDKVSHILGLPRGGILTIEFMPVSGTYSTRSFEC